MFPKPRTDLTPKSADFERLPFIKQTGFREYDARWLYPDEINLMGLQAVGLGLAELFRRRGVPPGSLPDTTSAPIPAPSSKR